MTRTLNLEQVMDANGTVKKRYALPSVLKIFTLSALSGRFAREGGRNFLFYAFPYRPIDGNARISLDPHVDPLPRQLPPVAGHKTGES